MSAFETLKSGYNDKYEYIFPEVTLNKNLYSDSWDMETYKPI